ncbi:phosphatidylinositol 4-phosphate 5-kinase 4-like [Haliotis rubra]|uniref:phosphatidylinositol 4-phosphate 5-kinase 4-like n=1 Tax=Haliotis rubra TaxID=36100 RepID=UPI001EE589C1|nr:phosphatidylinositol 4-phosphate 5-kinase 4-like [Haliotis rubra]
MKRACLAHFIKTKKQGLLGLELEYRLWKYSKAEAGALEPEWEGTHTITEGVVYLKDQWAGDKMNGQGKLTHPSGSVYIGEFNNNQFHGTGKYVWPNGSFYEGQFVENK